MNTFHRPHWLSASVVVLPALAILIALAIETRSAELDTISLTPKDCSQIVRDTSGLLPPEFSGSEACAKALVDGWTRATDSDGGSLKDYAVSSVRWDFLFIPSYVGAVVALALWVRTQTRREYWAPLLAAAAGAIAVAGLLDIGENVGLLRLLDQQTGPWVGAVFWLTAAKFALAVVALLIVTTAWIGVESQRSIFFTSSPHGDATSTDAPAGAAPAGPSLWTHVARGAMYIWPLRVEIIAALFLFAFPFLLYSPDMERYLSGIFDPLEAAALMPITTLALLCAWTLAIMLRLILTYGHTRLGLPELKLRGRRVPGRMWTASALLAVPIVVAVVRQSHLESSRSIEAMLLYASFGVIAACTLLAVSLRAAHWMAAKRRHPVYPLYQWLLAWCQRHPFLGSGFVSNNQPPALLPGHGIALFLGMASLLAYFAVGVMTRDVSRPVYASTLAYVLLLTLSLSWMYGLFAFLFDRTRVPLLVYLLAWTIVLNYGLGWLFSTDLEYETYVIDGGRLDAADQQQQSAIDRREIGDTPILVAASGGGIQAAAWTAQVLTGLADEFSGIAFEKQVRLLSGVSGGSVGIMHYLTQNPACYPPDDGKLPPTTRAEALAHAMESSLHAVGWGLVYQDLPRTVLPFLTSAVVNRGLLLEDAWKRDARLQAAVDAARPEGSARKAPAARPKRAISPRMAEGEKRWRIRATRRSRRCIRCEAPRSARATGGTRHCCGKPGRAKSTS